MTKEIDRVTKNTQNDKTYRIAKTYRMPKKKDRMTKKTDRVIKETDRQTDRQTDKQTDRQSDKRNKEAKESEIDRAKDSQMRLDKRDRVIRAKLTKYNPGHNIIVNMNHRRKVELV